MTCLGSSSGVSDVAGTANRTFGGYPCSLWKNVPLGRYLKLLDLDASSRSSTTTFSLHQILRHEATHEARQPGTPPALRHKPTPLRSIPAHRRQSSPPLLSRRPGQRRPLLRNRPPAGTTTARRGAPLRKGREEEEAGRAAQEREGAPGCQQRQGPGKVAAEEALLAGCPHQRGRWCADRLFFPIEALVHPRHDKLTRRSALSPQAPTRSTSTPAPSGTRRPRQ